MNVGRYACMPAVVYCSVHVCVCVCVCVCVYICDHPHTTVLWRYSSYICVCVCVCVYMQDQHIEMSTSIIIIMLKHRSVTRHMREYDTCTSLKAGVAKHSLGTVVVISRMGDCLLNPIYSAEQWTIKE